MGEINWRSKLSSFTSYRRIIRPVWGNPTHVKGEKNAYIGWKEEKRKQMSAEWDETKMTVWEERKERKA